MVRKDLILITWRNNKLKWTGVEAGKSISPLRKVREVTMVAATWGRRKVMEMERKGQIRDIFWKKI